MSGYGSLAVGFLCPKCDGKVTVTYTTRTSVNGKRAIRRRRACVKCNYRYNTFEMELNNLIRDARFKVAVARAKRQIGKALAAIDEVTEAQ